MVGWVGRLVGIQITSIVGTIAIVVAIDRLLPLKSVIMSAVLGMVVSGAVFFWAAYTLVDWDTVSGSLEFGSDTSRLGD